MVKVKWAATPLTPLLLHRHHWSLPLVTNLGIRGTNGGSFADGDAYTRLSDSQAVYQRTQTISSCSQEGDQSSSAFSFPPIVNVLRSNVSGTLDALPELEADLNWSRVSLFQTHVRLLR